MPSPHQPEAARPAGGQIALTNVRVFDGRQLRPAATVVIAGGRIGTGPAGAEVVIDGAGGVLLPGLIDAHVHLDGPGRLAELARYGVTTALDMASVPEETAAWRGIAGQADFRSSGIPAIAPGSLHSHFPGVGQRGLVTGPDDARRFAADRVAEGADYLKIVVGSPLADHDQATVDALVAAAREHGLLVVAHASSAAAVAKAQRAGADVLTHAPLDQPLGAAALAHAVRAGQVAVPTLTMMETIVSALAPPGAAYESARASVTALHQAGVPVLAGTDANATAGSPAGVPHGASLHRELELLAAAGLPAAEVLRAATELPARYFGLADRGRIEPGLRADLVLIDGDPLADIRATRSIRRVWCDGIEVTPQTRGSGNLCASPMSASGSA
jgi:imidazolonepropionase-like amidohydrolase